MPNTLLYQDTGAEDFVYYRSWDGGKGSSTVYSGSLRSLAEDMKRFGYLFKEPFDPEGGVPTRDNWDNIDPLQDLGL